MSITLLIAIAIRLAALVYSILLLIRLRDLRLAAVTVMYATILVRPVTTSLNANGFTVVPTNWSNDGFALFLSVLTVLAIVILDNILTENRRTLERLDDAQRRARIGNFECELRTGVWYWSDTLYGIYGIDPGAIIRAETVESMIHPDDRARIVGQFEAARAALAPYHVVFRLGDGRGEWKQVEARGQFESDAKGRARRFRGTLQDITEQRRAEDALRESEAALAQANRLLQLVLDTLPIRVFWKDRNSTYLGCNRVFAADAGLKSAADIVGKTDLDLVWSEHADRYRANDLRVIESGVATPATEMLDRSPMGQPVWLRMMLTPLLDGSGQCIGVLGAYENITPQKQVEQERSRLESQLIRAQKMETVGQLAGGVAHDFNNLLVAMLGYAELGERHPETPETLKRYFREIRLVAEKAAELTKQLLALGRRQVLTFEPVDLNELVRSMSGILQRVLPESIAFTFAPAPAPATVWGDSGQLQQVILNLVLNARDAMPAGGSVSIETALVHAPAGERSGTTAEVPSVELRVRDTGAGIAPEDMTSIFEPFFTTKPEGKGTGLGLAVVQGIVEQHRGTINVESSRARGTEFRIRLASVAAGPAKAAAPATERSVSGSETILLVEDNETVRTLMHKLLEGAGYGVIEAVDGVEAVDCVRTRGNSIELVLMDVVMPRMSGPEAFDQIRDLTPDMPVLFASGYAMDNLPEGFLADHGLELIPKPFRAQALLESVRRTLDVAAAKRRGARA